VKLRKVAKLGPVRSSESLNYARSIERVVYYRVGAAAFVAAGSSTHNTRRSSGGGGGACRRRCSKARNSARDGHPAAWRTELGQELLDLNGNPTPVQSRRGGPLRPPAGGKFEFEPSER
jgi:hypothetical protein